MLSILGQPRRTCDGLTRREILRAGALSLFGATLLPAAAAAGAAAGRARSVILLDLFGGPSHIDTFDLKPGAPKEVRGEFQPIATSLPGLQICEHLPQLARWMHRVSLIRTVSHGYNSHNPYAVMTGFTGGNDREDYFARPSNHPSMGSVCQYFGVGQKRGLPGYVVLPAFPGYSQGLRRAGPYGGYLGSQYDPAFQHLRRATFRASRNRTTIRRSFRSAIRTCRRRIRTSPLDALDQRRSLLDQIDNQARLAESSRGAGLMTTRQRQAFELLLSPAARRAFDLAKEPPTVRDRYGRDVFGQSVLLARRLVEAGVTFVTVHTEAKGAGHWDTHDNNFGMLRAVPAAVLRSGRDGTAGRTGWPRSAGLDAGDGERRHGPYAARQRARRAAITGRSAASVCSLAAASRRDLSWVTATSRPPIRLIGRCRRAILSARCIICWASIPSGQCRINSADRSRSTRADSRCAKS